MNAEDPNQPQALSPYGLTILLLRTVLGMASLRAQFAEMFQVLQVACDQRFFLCTTPALELPLSGQRLAFRGIRLEIDETNGAVLERVGRAPTIVVGLQAGLELLCGANV